MTSSKRRFFRINDTLGVACRPLTPRELGKAAAGVALAPVDALSVLNLCNEAISTHSKALHKRDKLAANLIDALNKKLDSVLDHLEVADSMLKGVSHKLQLVNISACGAAFIRAAPLLTDTWVSLNLLMKPSTLVITTYGKIVGCEPCEGGFYVRINFENMEAAIQEPLIQHLMKRQKELLRGGQALS